MSQFDQQRIDLRKKQKASHRREDCAQLKHGVSKKRLQRRNSALSDSFFDHARIENLSSAVGA